MRPKPQCPTPATLRAQTRKSSPLPTFRLVPLPKKPRWGQQGRQEQTWAQEKCGPPDPQARSPPPSGGSPLLGGAGHAHLLCAQMQGHCCRERHQLPAGPASRRHGHPLSPAPLPAALLGAPRTSFHQGPGPARGPHSEDTGDLSGSGVRRRGRVTCQAVPSRPDLVLTER